ncbi:hypothetical protein AB0G83_07445 [Streptomyces klenkii]|uniref:hypothetical protein n=1 Tax=Streptomyces klenkii TaxID=1420899 RepID=UPI0034052385
MFALSFARPCPPEGAIPYRYDDNTQMSVLTAGGLVVRDRAALMGTSFTWSTAGSKTHRDDTEPES